MKYAFFWSILAAMMLSVCGCNAAPEQDVARTIDVAEDGSISIDDVKILSQENRGDEIVTCYQPENLYQLPVHPFDLSVETYGIEADPTAEELIRQAEENGIIVVGSASGVREGHLSELEAYTITEFDVTTLYRGEETAAKLRVRECYALASENNRYVYRCATGACTPMHNDVPMLLLLEQQTNSYGLICDPIVLSAPTELGREIMTLLGIIK